MDPFINMEGKIIIVGKMREKCHDGGETENEKE